MYAVRRVCTPVVVLTAAMATALVADARASAVPMSGYESLVPISEAPSDAGSRAAPGAAEASQDEAGSGENAELSVDERLLLEICELVVHAFHEEESPVWPGYSLAEQPFLVYVPERWALLVNPAARAEGFVPLPPWWPDVELDGLYHEGTYRDLIGQLEFDVDIAGTPTVALGIPPGFTERIERPGERVFAYIVHEAFHQHQHAVFGEIPWAREARYPIDDAENAALAWLEMILLRDALEAVVTGDDDLCAARSRQFVAVRLRRWEQATPFIAEYECGKELQEGTAKYVELGYLARAGAMEGASPLAPSVDTSARRLSFPERVLEELDSRMEGGCLEPQDIPRNRIYAVAAAQAYLLDHFGVDWKRRAEEAGPEFTYVRLLQSRLGVVPDMLDRLLEGARREQGFQEVSASAREAVRRYEEACASELEAFESQGGTRIEVAVVSSGFSRSRLSADRKWLMEGGRACLCRRFDVYTLAADDWRFELRGAGLFERNHWDAGLRELVLYDAGTTSVCINGAEPGPPEYGTTDFESIVVEGSHFELSSFRAGTLEVGDARMRLDFQNASR